MNEKMKVTIERDKWVYGHQSTGKLYNPDTGCFCAVGFILLAEGFTPEQMKGKTMPQEVDLDATSRMTVIEGAQELLSETCWAGDVMHTNDSVNEREALEARLLVLADEDESPVEFVFVDTAEAAH